MNAKDLRIGNIVTIRTAAENEFTRINGNDLWHAANLDNPLHRLEWDSLLPIKITEAWLKKLGFENNRISINTLDELAYMFDGHEWSLRYQTKGSGFTRDYDVKYVHQLQNLFHCLTGKELSCE